MSKCILPILPQPFNISFTVDNIGQPLNAPYLNFLDGWMDFDVSHIPWYIITSLPSVNNVDSFFIFVVCDHITATPSCPPSFRSYPPHTLAFV